MNIAIFTDTFTPQINGVSEVTKNLKSGLEARGHKVWIVAPKIRGYHDTDPQIIRMPSFQFPGVSEHRLSFVNYRKVNRKWIRKNKIDLLHSQTAGPLGIMAVIIARQAKIPHVHHYQTFFEDYVHYVKLPRAFSRWGVRRVSGWFCNHTDLITVPTYPFKTILESYGITREIRLWQSGIDIAKFRKGKSMRKEWGIPSNAFVLVFVGRVAMEKNISFLIELMPELKSLDRDVRLLIVGDGPMRSELERYAENLGVENRVVFTGYIPPEEIPNVYHSSDLFVFSSLTETQGLVTLEAMAAGLPVVAVSAYGIKYMLQDAEGAILLNLNHKEFIKQIRLLMNPKVYSKMSEKARGFVQGHGYGRSTEAIITIYKDLLKKYGR